MRTVIILLFVKLSTTSEVKLVLVDIVNSQHKFVNEVKESR